MLTSIATPGGVDDPWKTRVPSTPPSGRVWKKGKTGDVDADDDVAAGGGGQAIQTIGERSKEKGGVGDAEGSNSWGGWR